MSDKQYFTELKASILALNEADTLQCQQKVDKVLDIYGEIFDLLLPDSNSKKALVHTLETPQQVRDYCASLLELNDSVNQLPDSFEYKSLLLERLQDSINFDFINKYQNKFVEDPEQAYRFFLDTNKNDDISTTVEVRTWGTQREYSTGLRNVIQQKFRNDDVGHAALVMRLPVNYENKTLVETYCSNKNMKHKIPVQIQKWHGKHYYEIYWSFWPGSLNTIGEDFDKETATIEYREAQELEANVPQELSEQYILHRYKNSKLHSFAAPVERIKDGKVVSNETNEIIKLYESFYKLKEEIRTIDLLQKNYLGRGKPFNPDNIDNEKTISSGSNLLVIVGRFKNEFKNKARIAKILLDKKISTTDAEFLQQEVVTILKKRRDQFAKIDALVQRSLSSFSTETYDDAIEQIEEIKKEKDLCEQTQKNLEGLLFSSERTLNIHLAENKKYREETAKYEEYNKQNNYLVSLNQQISVWGKLLKRQNVSKKSFKITYIDENSIEHVKILGDKVQFNQFVDRIKVERDALEKKVRSLKVVAPKAPKPINEVAELQLMGYKKIFNLKSCSELQVLIDEIKKEKSSLECKTSALTEALEKRIRQSKILRVRLDCSKDQLINKKLKRGVPYNSSTLRGFNVEAMIKKASALAASVDDFHLKEENCSTTSLKILKEGASSKNNGDTFSYSELFNYSDIPEVAKKYKLVIHPGTTGFTIEPGKIYLSNVKGKLAYSLLTAKAGVVENVVIDDFDAPEPFVIDAISKDKYHIFEHLSSKKYIPKVKFDSSTFLSNPQAVYCAARLCEKLDGGDLLAKKLVAEFLAKERSQTELYGFANELASKSDSELRKLQTNYSLVFRFLFKVLKDLGFLRFMMILGKLYTEYNTAIHDDRIVETKPLLGHVEEAIKALNENKFYYITTRSIPGAIGEMIELMRESPYIIPFFSNDLVKNSNQYILKLEAKSQLSEDEAALIDSYKKIIEARNTRIKVVEEALLSGKNIKASLLSLNTKLDKLDYHLSDKHMNDYKVSVFVKAYTDKLNFDSRGNSRAFLASLFYRLKHTVISKILNANSSTEALKIIEEHVTNDKNGWTARIWNGVISNNILVRKEMSRRSSVDENIPKIQIEGAKCELLVSDLPHLSLFGKMPVGPVGDEKGGYKILRAKLLIDMLLNKIKKFHAQNKVEDRNNTILDLYSETREALSVNILIDKLLLDKELQSILDVYPSDREECGKLVHQKMDECANKKKTMGRNHS